MGTDGRAVSAGRHASGENVRPRAVDELTDTNSPARDTTASVPIWDCVPWKGANTYTPGWRLSRPLPITEVHVENTVFAPQLLRNPEIRGIEYQQGPLYRNNLRHCHPPPRRQQMLLMRQVRQARSPRARPCDAPLPQRPRTIRQTRRRLTIPQPQARQPAVGKPTKTTPKEGATTAVAVAATIADLMKLDCISAARMEEAPENRREHWQLPDSSRHTGPTPPPSTTTIATPHSSPVPQPRLNLRQRPERS